MDVQFRTLNAPWSSILNRPSITVRRVNSLKNRIDQIVEDTGALNVELADAAGCSKALVTLWRNGIAKTIDFEHAKGIADRYDYNVEWIVSGKGEKRPPGASTETVDSLLNELPPDLAMDFLRYMQFRIKAMEDVSGAAFSPKYYRMIDSFIKNMAERDPSKASGESSKPTKSKPKKSSSDE